MKQRIFERSDQVHLARGVYGTEREDGQILAMFALLLPLLLLFIGLAIDFGFGFLTKAELSKASDAASLAVMRNLGRGQTEAAAIGSSVFALNYDARSKLNATTPTIHIAFSSDAYGDPVVNVSAAATIKTFFVRIAGFRTLSVASYSQATRPPVVLSMVLDRSTSMNYNGGASALPPSVQDFLAYFIEGTDRVGEVSFSSVATEDVAISKNFQKRIQKSLNRMSFLGATYARGGLLDAQTQVEGVVSPPPNAVKVVVFFTDGWANTNQDTLTCNGGGNGHGGGKKIKLNYGGCSPVEQAVGWCNGISMLSPTDGSAVSCSASTFPVQAPGISSKMDISNISTDSMYRAVQLADVMRAQGTTVYSIGLGDKINKTYLQELANDPASPEYNPAEPSGIAAFAPDASDLDSVFQTVASKILLRLTQ